MRQQNKPGSREARRDEEQAQRTKIFVGGCSKCGAKRVKVVRMRGNQLCVGKCVGAAISCLSGATQMPANQAIKVD